MGRKACTSRNCHCRYNLYYHLVLVTKYRNPAINDDVLKTTKECVEEIFRRNKCEIHAINYDTDHIHIMFSAPPQIFVGNLKTVTSQMVRKNHSAWIGKFYWKPIFWSRSYYLGTIGETTIETV